MITYTPPKENVQTTTQTTSISPSKDTETDTTKEENTASEEGVESETEGTATSGGVVSTDLSEEEIAILLEYNNRLQAVVRDVYYGEYDVYTWNQFGIPFMEEVLEYVNSSSNLVAKMVAGEIRILTMWYSDHFQGKDQSDIIYLCEETIDKYLGTNLLTDDMNFGY